MTAVTSIESEGPRGLSAALRATEPIYLLPKDDVAASVIIPGLATSSSAEVMIGFFASQALAEIAPGLASYLRATTAPLRLIVSPYLTAADQEALRQGLSADSLAETKIGDALPDADALAGHALSCLSWLIAQGRLEMKIALMRDALFHPKVWLFHDGADVAALHGSANMTGAGLGRNREQLSLARGWMSDDAARTCARLTAEFDMLWDGGDNDCVVVDLPKAIEDRLLRDYGIMIEDAIEPVLVELGLIRPSAIGDAFEFVRGPKASLPDEVFAICLDRFWRATHGEAATLSVEAACYGRGSPGRVFKLDEESVVDRLIRIDEATRGALVWSETAGLKQVVRKSAVDEAAVLGRAYGSERRLAA